MFERGGFSFVALLVINPLVILLFQNCAFIPTTQSELADQVSPYQKRTLSSVRAAEKWTPHHLSASAPALAGCQGRLTHCPVSDIE